MVSLLIKRYLWLVNILGRYPQGLTLNEINGHWKESSLYKDCGGREISRRTLYNHCNAILDQFDILIKVRQAGKYSKYILSSETSDEDYEEIRKWMLNSFATENLLSDCRSIHYKILLEAADTGATHLECIKEALKQNRLLAVDYQGFHLLSPEQKDMVIAPLALKMFKKRWYLLCHNIKKDSKRLYALDRIIRCELLPETFSYPEDFCPQDYFSDYYGVSTDGYSNKAIKVKINAYRELPNYLKSQPLHHSQRIVYETEEYTQFDYFMIPAFDFVQELLAHCEQLEVVEPESLRNRIVRILENSLEFYKSMK